MNTEETVRSEYFATLKDGRIVTYASAVPAHELLPNQIALTREEYDILHAINGKMEKAIQAIRAVKAKIKANGS